MDRFTSYVVVSITISLLERVSYDHLDIVRPESVQDVEKVVSIGLSPLWVLVRQVLHDERVVLDLRVDLLNRQLVILRHTDHLDLRHLEQFLLLSEYLL